MGDSHFSPMFIAKDIDELRNNPETRKALRMLR
jgi:hypothetical protein